MTPEFAIDPSGTVTQGAFWGGRPSASPPPNKGEQSLSAMMRVEFRTESKIPRKDSLCTLVHEKFRSELERHFLVAPLLPLCVWETLDRLAPDHIIVHRSAFEEGVWYGADSLYGGDLIDEIRLIGDWARSNDRPVVTVDNGLPEKYYGGILEEIGTVHFPNTYFFSRLSEGARRNLIYELAEASSDKLASWEI